MTTEKTSLQKVVAGEISRDEFVRDYRRGNAPNEHPIGFRLKDQGLFDHECVVDYYKLRGEPAPVPSYKVATLVRRTTIQIDEVGEIFEATRTNFANRLRWLYRLTRRTMSESHEQFVEYEDGSKVRLTDAEIDRLRPQPLGTAPHYDNEIKPTPTLLGLIQAYRIR